MNENIPQDLNGKPEFDLPRPIPIDALLIDMIAPNGKLVRILDIEDYVPFMEHMGYVRVSKEVR